MLLNGNEKLCERYIHIHILNKIIYAIVYITQYIS